MDIILEGLSAYTGKLSAWPHMLQDALTDKSQLLAQQIMVQQNTGTVETAPNGKGESGASRQDSETKARITQSGGAKEATLAQQGKQRFITRIRHRGSAVIENSDLRSLSEESQPDILAVYDEALSVSLKS